MRACSPWLRRIASLILDSVAILVRAGIRPAFCPGYEFVPPGYVAPSFTIAFNIILPLWGLEANNLRGNRETFFLRTFDAQAGDAQKARMGRCARCEDRAE